MYLCAISKSSWMRVGGVAMVSRHATRLEVGPHFLIMLALKLKQYCTHSLQHLLAIISSLYVDKADICNKKTAPFQNIRLHCPISPFCTLAVYSYVYLLTLWVRKNNLDRVHFQKISSRISV